MHLLRPSSLGQVDILQRFCIFIILVSVWFHSCCSTNLKTVNVKSSVPSPALKAKLTTDSDWIQASLQRHNYLRSLHSAPPLVLNTTLCEISQSWANYLLARSLANIRNKEDVAQGKFHFDHNYESNQKFFIGENLYFSTHSKGDRINGTIAVTLWYNEIKDYDFQFAKVKSTSKPDSLIYHFTQLVWLGTKQMGTAFAMGQLPTGQLVTFVVANYYPSGNVISGSDFPQKLFIKNVVPPTSDAENEVEDVSSVIKDKITFWEITTAEITTPQTWIDLAVDQHNQFRSHHGFPHLSESPQLTQVAQSWANQLVTRSVKEFNTKWSVDARLGFKNYGATEKAQFGENIMYFIGEGVVDPQHVVSLWYQERRYYDFKNYGPNPNKSRTAQTRHYEQILWKSTTHLGIAFASEEAENGQIVTFVVAYYHRQGPRGATLEEKIANLPSNICDSISSNRFTIVLVFILIYFIG